jgi:hypothetical protein
MTIFRGLLAGSFDGTFSVDFNAPGIDSPRIIYNTSALLDIYAPSPNFQIDLTMTPRYAIGLAAFSAKSTLVNYPWDE